MSLLRWQGLPLPEDTKTTTWWTDWDGYYTAECPHGQWAVWDAAAIVPLCACE